MLKKNCCTRIEETLNPEIFTSPVSPYFSAFLCSSPSLSFSKSCPPKFNNQPFSTIFHITFCRTHVSIDDIVQLLQEPFNEKKVKRVIGNNNPFKKLFILRIPETTRSEMRTRPLRCGSRRKKMRCSQKQR